MELASAGETERAPSAHRCCVLSCAYGQGAGGQELCFYTGSSGLLHIAQIPSTAKQHKGRRSWKNILLSCRNACPPLTCHPHVTVWQTCSPQLLSPALPLPCAPQLSHCSPSPPAQHSSAYEVLASAASPISVPSLFCSRKNDKERQKELGCEERFNQLVLFSVWIKT